MNANAHAHAHAHRHTHAPVRPRDAQFLQTGGDRFILSQTYLSTVHARARARDRSALSRSSGAWLSLLLLPSWWSSRCREGDSWSSRCLMGGLAVPQMSRGARRSLSRKSTSALATLDSVFEWHRAPRPHHETATDAIAFGVQRRLVALLSVRLVAALCRRVIAEGARGLAGAARVSQGATVVQCRRGAVAWCVMMRPCGSGRHDDRVLHVQLVGPVSLCRPQL